MIRYIDPEVACQAKKEAEFLLFCGAVRGGKVFSLGCNRPLSEIRGDTLGGNRSLTELGICQGDPVSPPFPGRKFRRLIVSGRDI